MTCVFNRNHSFYLLAHEALEQGIRENDRMRDQPDVLSVLCGIINIHSDEYHAALDYIYGKENRDGPLLRGPGSK